MWCYQKPGFEALVLAELQRQQQCSQFCDTLLKTEGVSVPAHSCILSAISPHISSALSSMTPPSAGQTRLLEFRALDACTLLHMVRLLYCGEMAGEGEKEKQEAISAAARLGINGLVEVTKRSRKSRDEEGEEVEVGVQTELLMPDENGGRPGRWRREVMDGSTFLWREMLSDGKKDAWTQTEELQAQTVPLSQPAASFETIDMDALRSLGQTDSQLVPYIPVSLVYPPDNQTLQLSSALMDSMQESTAAGPSSVVAPQYTFPPPPLLPFSSQETPCVADPQSWWAGPQGAPRGVVAAAEWEDQQLEQFQGNIPEYIDYFLNPDTEQGSGRGRPRKRQGAGVGGARRAGTGERRARRPRARAGGRGRGRGGLTQMVDVQEVGVSRLQKLFLHRWAPSRTGQGGGAVGRKLYLNTRELLKSAKTRRGRGKAGEFSLRGDTLPFSEEGGGNKQRGRRRTTQQSNQDGPPAGRARRAGAKPTTSVSFSSPDTPFYNAQILSAFSPSVQLSPSPAASFVPPASSLIHNTSLPPPAPPPHEEQPEHFERLLEEVMMGLDILPNNNSGASHSQPPPPTSSSSCAIVSCDDNSAQNKQDCTTGFLEASAGFHRVVAVSRGVAGSSNDGPILQQQGEGELTYMLDQFLQSFEQQVDSCTAREEEETEAAESKYGNTRHLQNTLTPCPARQSQITELQQRDEVETSPRCSRLCKAAARSAAPPKHTEGSPGKVGPPAKKRKRRTKNEYPFSIERKRVRVRKPVLSCDAKAQIIRDQRDKQLQQMPVVKLRRSGPLPARVILQEPSCLEVKSTAITKIYPIRSWFREAKIMDNLPLLVEPLQIKQPPSADRSRCSQGRPSKTEKPSLSLSNGESSASPVQSQPVEPCGSDGQLEKNRERREEESTVQPQEEAEGAARRGASRRGAARRGAARRGTARRGAESEEATCDDSPVAKRVCFVSTSETPSSQPIATREINVSPPSVSNCVQREDKSARSEIQLKERESSLMDEEMESSDEIIDVDGDCEDDRCQSRATQTLSYFVKVTPFVSPSPCSAKEVSLGSTRSWKEEDEEIDVIGSSSPAPDPVVISWTKSSEGEEEEEEDIDVVGDEIIATVSTSELVDRKYQTKVLLC